MNVKPITPSEVIASKQIPDVVIETFNQEISKKWDGRKSVVFQDEVVDILISKLANEWTANDIYEAHWMDVEPIFRKAGWIVDYDKPGYNENYRPTYTFRKKGKK